MRERFRRASRNTQTLTSLSRFRMALELSLFYSPRLAGELRALAFARQTYMHKVAPPAPPAALAGVSPSGTHLEYSQDAFLIARVYHRQLQARCSRMCTRTRPSLRLELIRAYPRLRL